MSKFKTEPESILWDLLRTKRPHASQGIEAIMTRIESLFTNQTFRDAKNNLWLDLRAETGSTTMFMGHLDSVETQEGQNHLVISSDGIIDTEGRAILGADDGAGVALLVSLAQGGLPALYLFSQKEESGGDGGKFAASKTMEHLWKDSVDRLISFDRKGTKDICGEQFCGTLASEAFVFSLAEKLGMGHSWATGSYTDNSEFQGKIKEIVNVAIGYEANHGVNETLDYIYFTTLRQACLKLDWESLPTVGPDTSNDWDGLGAYGYVPRKTKTFQTFADWENCQMEREFWPEDVIEDEFMILCDALDLDPCGWEAGQVRNSLDRSFDAGFEEGKAIKLYAKKS